MVTGSAAGARFPTDLLTQGQIGAQLGVEALGRPRTGQGCRPCDVGTGGHLIARQAVQQIAVVQWRRIVWEGGHHGVAAEDLFGQLVELHGLEAVIAAHLPLGQGLLSAARGQEQQPGQSGQAGAPPWAMGRFID